MSMLPASASDHTIRQIVAEVGQLVLRTLPQGWRITDGYVAWSFEAMDDVVTLHLKEPTQGWGTTLTARADARAIDTLKGQARAYVDQCMASTLPTPHQA